MPSLVAVQTSNTQWKPLHRPVALFLGGTSGIGQAMAERLAGQTKGRAHIILLGRNKDAAEKIISGFPRHDESMYEFERIDATSMRDVRRVTRSLLERLDKVNFIVASAGFLTMKGRDETEEGIDKKLACNIYSRFRFAFDLLHLLERAADAGEDAKFMTILAAGREPTSYLNIDDLGLKKEYTLRNAGAVASHYNDALIEVCLLSRSAFPIIDPYPSQEFARRSPNVSFTHIYPGVVSTSMTTNFHWSTRALAPLLRFITTSPVDCAEWMWSSLWSSDPAFKSGAHRLDNHGEPVKPNKAITPEVAVKIWEHAVELTDK